jgi:hypothetical protein
LIVQAVSCCSSQVRSPAVALLLFGDATSTTSRMTATAEAGSQLAGDVLETGYHHGGSDGVHGSGAACALRTSSCPRRSLLTQLVRRLRSSTRTWSRGSSSLGRPHPSAAHRGSTAANLKSSQGTAVRSRRGAGERGRSSGKVPSGAGTISPLAKKGGVLLSQFGEGVSRVRTLLLHAWQDDQPWR